MCAADTGKPKWVEKWGTIANLISAGAAVSFGVAAAFISYSTWDLQSTTANDAALARDNDNLARYANFLVMNGDRFDTSNRCLSAFIWYIDKGHIKKLNLLDDRDSLYRDFQRPIGDKDIDEGRLACLGEKKSLFLSNFFFLLNIQEIALSNYTNEISSERKKIYYKQLRVVSCTKYTNIRNIFENYDNRLGNIFRSGFPNVAEFVEDCDSNKVL